ncbi:MAG: hypothetical protein EA357_04130 [Micavibrio sp.]|nr:MAG: hypothetical protein EA357_04130 [Micavibrio sp.]
MVEYFFPMLLAVFAVQFLADLVFPLNAKTARPFLWLFAGDLAENFSGRMNDGKTPAGTFAATMRGMLCLILFLCIAVALGATVKFISSIMFFAQPAILFICLYICVGFFRPLRILKHLQKLLAEQPPERAQITGIFAALHLPVPPISKPMAPYAQAGVAMAAYHLNILLVAPLFWFFVYDLYGMFAYVLVMAATVTMPVRADNAFFGHPLRIAARLLDIVPAFLTALLLIPASLAVRGARPDRLPGIVSRNPIAVLSSGLQLLAAVMAAATGAVLSGIAPHWYADGDMASGLDGGSGSGDAAAQKQLQAARRIAAVFFVLIAGLAVLFSMKFALGRLFL